MTWDSSGLAALLRQQADDLVSQPRSQSTGLSGFMAQAQDDYLKGFEDWMNGSRGQLGSNKKVQQWFGEPAQGKGLMQDPSGDWNPNSGTNSTIGKADLTGTGIPERDGGINFYDPGDKAFRPSRPTLTDENQELGFLNNGFDNKLTGQLSGMVGIPGLARKLFGYGVDAFNRNKSDKNNQAIEDYLKSQGIDQTNPNYFEYFIQANNSIRDNADAAAFLKNNQRLQQYWGDTTQNSYINPGENTFRPGDRFFTPSDGGMRFSDPDGNLFGPSGGSFNPYKILSASRNKYFNPEYYSVGGGYGDGL